MEKHYGGLFSDWEVAVAKSLVDRFQRGGTCLEREDFDDLLQECLLAWYYAREKYDPGRGALRRTYMARIVRNRLRDLIQEREYDKRRISYITDSLDAPVSEDEDSPSLIDTLQAAASPDIQLKIDLQRTIESLSEQQQLLCHLLGEMGLTVQEASVRLNVPRTSVYDEIKRIRQVFEKQGITNFLRNL